uniref:Putative ovule protein n=1 Tax=Solanum chacoense TaxID=4108 RepID=A0A0V0GNF1_SOLCH
MMSSVRTTTFVNHLSSNHQHLRSILVLCSVFLVLGQSGNEIKMKKLSDIGPTETYLLARSCENANISLL